MQRRTRLQQATSLERWQAACRRVEPVECWSTRRKALSRKAGRCIQMIQLKTGFGRFIEPGRVDTSGRALMDVLLQLQASSLLVVSGSLQSARRHRQNVGQVRIAQEGQAASLSDIGFRRGLRAASTSIALSRDMTRLAASDVRFRQGGQAMVHSSSSPSASGTCESSSAVAGSLRILRFASVSNSWQTNQGA